MGLWTASLYDDMTTHNTHSHARDRTDIDVIKQERIMLVNDVLSVVLSVAYSVLYVPWMS